jgi:ABC-type amino acid transport substrate-binding protein
MPSSRTADTQGRVKMKRFFQVVSIALLTGLVHASATAGEVLDRVQRSGDVRVCVWPDYYGISYRNPKTRQFTGLDIDLSAEFARELGVRLQYVDSSFAMLVDDLLASRCDIAMFAVGVLPQREKLLRFSLPYLQSDIHAVTSRSSRVVRRWEDIDRPGVQVAVQAGTFMEPVMRETLQHATMVVIRPPATREQELEAGRVDVFMTDYPYSRRLLDNAEWARLISPPKPFHVLPYAYAVRPGDEEWLARINRFVTDMRQDGRLENAARRHRLSETVIRPAAR